MVGQVIISGVLAGALYALVALGLALIFGVMRVINIAHGPLLMLGAYTTYFLYSRDGLNPYLTLPVSMAVLFVVGLLLQRTLVFRVVDAPELSSLLLTFGISIALVNLAQLAFTSDLRAVEYLTGSWLIGPFALSKSRVIAFVFAAAPSRPLAFLFLQRDAARQGDPRHLAEPRGGDGVRDRRAAHPPAHLRSGQRAGRRRRRAASR